MTLPRLNALHKHWAKYPPAHISSALAAGIETRARPEAPQQPARKKLSNADVVRDMTVDPRFIRWRDVRA